MSFLEELLGLPAVQVKVIVIEVSRFDYIAAEQTGGGRQCFLGLDEGRIFAASALSLDDIASAYQSGLRSPGR